ncbi:MAG: hypothetical protein ABW032_06265 [Burkholderiaceae bacterium]
MREAPNLSNPFVMMTDPEMILAAVERSERLNLLNRRVYRPLDRPLIPKVGAKDVAEFDREIDDTPIEEASIEEASIEEAAPDEGGF